MRIGNLCASCRQRRARSAWNNASVNCSESSRDLDAGVHPARDNGRVSGALHSPREPRYLPRGWIAGRIRRPGAEHREHSRAFRFFTSFPHLERHLAGAHVLCRRISADLVALSKRGLRGSQRSLCVAHARRSRRAKLHSLAHEAVWFRKQARMHGSEGTVDSSGHSMTNCRTRSNDGNATSFLSSPAPPSSSSPSSCTAVIVVASGFPLGAVRLGRDEVLTDPRARACIDLRPHLCVLHTRWVGQCKRHGHGCQKRAAVFLTQR
mmetsp:Transcript_26346/g.91633  ORF Transcript_26346/g.91633 Transcript_26346/m.91633 type:complete len:265 (-) Transcript_26346:3360-4154(-)